ncbi:MAG: hypothetical protein RL583_21, partial [Actinomycetota bacterium]
VTRSNVSDAPAAVAVEAPVVEGGAN